MAGRHDDDDDDDDDLDNDDDDLLNDDGEMVRKARRDVKDSHYMYSIQALDRQQMSTRHVE
jgi:hypothetical protein